MKYYEITQKVVLTRVLKVRASSKKEAKDKAKERTLKEFSELNEVEETVIDDIQTYEVK